MKFTVTFQYILYFIINFLPNSLSENFLSFPRIKRTQYILEENASHFFT